MSLRSISRVHFLARHSLATAASCIQPNPPEGDRRRLRKIATAGALWALAVTAHAEPSLFGISGLINMPDARFAREGTWSLGVSLADPYNRIWSTASVLPFLEANLGLIQINGLGPSGIDAFDTSTYGDFKDKFASLKLQLFEEGTYLPSIAVGANDFTGTKLFEAEYLAASKRFGPLDLTVGYGRKRIDGYFYGARLRPFRDLNFNLVAEYDANNYKNDFSADITGVDQRDKGYSFAAEYKWNWFGVQLAYENENLSGNLYVSLPLQQKEFIPKLDEPPPFTKVLARPTLAMWDDDPKFRHGMLSSLVQQDFRDVSFRLEGLTMEVSLTNVRISEMSRAVGRAARIVLAYSPVEIREIRITYRSSLLPVATYVFFAPDKLQRYFNGTISLNELSQFVAVELPDKRAESERVDLSKLLDPQDISEFRFEAKDQGYASLRRDDFRLDRLALWPRLRTYFNGPKYLQFDLSAYLSWDKRLSDSTFFNFGAYYVLAENISDGIGLSDSLLPHVRSDAALYLLKKSNIDRMLVNQYHYLRPGLYGRLSAGFYELMYGGAGGGLLYAPARSPWAAGLSVDALWQRAPDKTFGFTGYNTVTAIASLHYKLAEGYMPSVHAGRFLAKDWGARFEFKRRFRSGIELGAWYTWTNGNDTTGPAVTEGSGTYQDKGVFAVIPLEAMLTRDTQVKATMSFSPWLRDVGQMVVPPTDLFGLVQDGWINMRECAGLEHFGELDEPAPCSQFTTSLLERPLLPLALNDSWSAGSELNLDPTWRYLALGVGLTLVSSSLDRQADKWVRDNPNNGTLQNVTDFGNNLPYAALGVAGLLAIDETDPRRSRTALSAVEAGVLGLLASETLKYPFGRARPKANQGPDDFQPFSQPDPGLPSTHATVMWATVTPFAKEYDMPWLYGLAAVTNFARMYDREHWLSDTVAGAAIGYGLGTMLWDWNRRKDMPQVGLQKNSVTLKWDLN